MSGDTLRDVLARSMFQRGRALGLPSWSMVTDNARLRWEREADAVLDILVEHRDEVLAVLRTHISPGWVKVVCQMCGQDSIVRKEAAAEVEARHHAVFHDTECWHCLGSGEFYPSANQCITCPHCNGTGVAT